MSYNIGLLALSFFIAVFGSFTALQLAIRIPTAENKSLVYWVLTAGLALGGGGIWSMHFVGMLAMEMPFEMSFDVALTVVSFVVAIVFVSLGFLIAGKDLLGDMSLLAGGVVAGLGVSAMHYIGMYSMIIPADVSYDATIVTLSVVIGVVAATVALWLAFNLRGNIQRFGSAFIMGVAVCGMHYTGMYAVKMTPNASIELASGISGSGLAGTVSIISAALLLSILYLAQLRSKQRESLA
ncbi:MHYT domain-containing protein [Aliikangiella coralliicola]|uniref:MHYT domain-containing protein n=1 Tax=Aliikangiella coralliicola TaxID=2592383 RepID=A0A545UJG1_9GAMM|nr:MHYT domain-containing protein [Aliikangiella coralliicola]TQV89600.1 hypothetical protein FLL46_01580 [Aliikangiella coralliicola]